jgi:hypothetical protein
MQTKRGSGRIHSLKQTRQMHREQRGSTSLEILSRDLIRAMRASGDVDSGQGALRADPFDLVARGAGID